MKLYLVLAVVVATVSGHHGHEHHEKTETALRGIARLVGDGIQGNITFTQKSDASVHIEGIITGLPPGEYGFHIYEKGDLTGGCSSIGSHFNPEMKDHGHPDDENRHVGDLGNAVFDKDHVSKIDIVDKLIALSGPNDVIGRALGLTSMPDDFGKTEHPDSKTTGNTGSPIACGIIGRL